MVGDIGCGKEDERRGGKTDVRIVTVLYVDCTNGSKAEKNGLIFRFCTDVKGVDAPLSGRGECKMGGTGEMELKS